MELSTVRLLFVSATERYREALMVGDLGLPTELAHSIETLTTLSFELQEVGTLGCTSDKAYNDMLEVGFRVIGSGYSLPIPSEALLKLVADFCPTHLVLQVPDKAILNWAIRNQIQVVAMFTENIADKQLEQGWDPARIASLLNHPLVYWVGSQGLKAADVLQQIGVEPRKIVPWSWPQLIESTAQPSKQLDLAEKALQLLYIGPLVSSKGVGDLFIALTQLRARGLKTSLKLVGTGETARFRDQVEQLQLVENVEFLETVPEQGLRELFGQADILVVPSRHEYPETNLNLVDDGLDACIPIVASDHPMFSGRLHHGVNAMIFPAGNARALAHRLERLTSQPQLYEQLSTSSQLVRGNIKALVPWAHAIEQWFQTDAHRDLWLAEHCLVSGRYASSVAEATYI